MVGVGCTLALKPSGEQLKSTAAVLLMLYAGIFAKWLSEAAARKTWEFDASLVGALLISPLVVLGAWSTFSAGPTLHSLLLCFSNGFFWQAIFADIERKNRGVRGATRTSLKRATESAGGAAKQKEEGKKKPGA